jgi:hypothetical protein
MAENQEAAKTQQGVCVNCERLLPGSNFRRDAAGRRTAWCETCRAKAAARWIVEPDQVEAVYALYVLEQTWKAEAEAVVQLRIQQGQDRPHDLQALQNRIAGYDRIRFTRIPGRLRAFHAESREAWYRGISMDVPVVAVQEAA